MSWEGEGSPVCFVDEFGMSILPVSSLDHLKIDLGHRLPQMRVICTLIADLANVRSALTKQTGINGHRYWTLPVSVVVGLGRIQLQARLQWEENVCRFISNRAL